MAQLVGLRVEGQSPLAIGFAGDDRLDAAILDLLAQLVAVIGLVAEQLRGVLGAPYQAPAERIIMRLPAAQDNG